MTRALSLFVVVVVATACPAPPRVAEGEGEEGEGEEGEGEGEEVAFVEVLDDVADLAVVADNGAAIKFVGPVDGVIARPPVGDRCLFQNMRLQQFHLTFLQSLEGGEDLDFQDYQSLVLRRPTRVWWGGEVKFRPGQPHPITGQPGFLAWTVYTEDTPGNRLILDDIRDGFALMSACAPAFAGRLAFVPVGTEQTTTAEAGVDVLAAEGIAVFIP